MPLSDEDVQQLAAQCTSVASCPDGGVECVLLSGLRLPRCTPDVVDALLCLGPRDNYPTRLFFSAPVAPHEPVALNWNANGVRILERNWHAFSWQVPAGLSAAETLREHLKPLR